MAPPEIGIIGIGSFGYGLRKARTVLIDTLSMMPVANAITSPALIGAVNASRVSSRGTNVTPTESSAKPTAAMVRRGSRSLSTSQPMSAVQSGESDVSSSARAATVSASASVKPLVTSVLITPSTSRGFAFARTFGNCARQAPRARSRPMLKIAHASDFHATIWKSSPSSSVIQRMSTASGATRVTAMRAYSRPRVRSGRPQQRAAGAESSLVSICSAWADGRSSAFGMFPCRSP